MFIKTFPAGPFSTNAYVLIDGSKGLIFDPAPGSALAIIEALSDVEVLGIYLTHSHWDHIADAFQLKEKFNIPVFVHALDSANLERPGSDGLPLMFPIQGLIPDGFLSDGQKIYFNHNLIEVIHTPGHSPGGVCFYFPEEGVLFSGDTLFKGTIGNLSFPTSNSDAMWQSLAKLAKLPKNTRVYPGHGAATSIGAESWLGSAQEHFS
ncbi:MAG: MBL fold metallo-hydrolase [Chlamydiales bacterium]|nr:MBL fold metallo-hydrolase [Chlamydiales bacterium]